MVIVVPQMHEDKSRDGSAVRMKSTQIIEMALLTLKSIRAYRTRALQKFTDDLRNKWIDAEKRRSNSMWSSIFGYKEKPTPSDEELIKTYNNSGEGVWMPETAWIEASYSKNEEVAHRLMNAARHAEEIYVSTEDLQRLF